MSAAHVYLVWRNGETVAMEHTRRRAEYEAEQFGGTVTKHLIKEGCAIWRRHMVDA